MIRRGNAIAQLLGAVLLVAVPPLALGRLVGRPLPSGGIDLDGVVDALATGAIPGSFWTMAMSAAAWVLWAAFVVLLLAELVAVVRDHPSSSWTPVVVRALAQRIVAAALMVTSTVGPTSAALAAVPAPVVTATSPTEAARTSPVEQPGHTVLVEDDDSWAGWADRTFGDPSIGPQVRAENIGQDVGGTVLDGSEPWVEAGWMLRLPPDVPVPAAVPSPATPVRVTGPSQNVPTSVDVEPGDSLWRIAEEEVGDGREWKELWDENGGRPMTDGTTFTDHDLIRPGWSLDLPATWTSIATGTQQPSPASSPADRLDALDGGERWEHGPSDAGGDTVPGVEQDAVGSPAQEADPVSDAADTQPPVTVGHDSWVDTVRAAPAVAAPSPVVDAAGTPAPAGDDGTEVDQDDAEQLTAWGTPAMTAGLAAALLAAAGTTAILRRRRRRAMAVRSAGLRFPTAAPDVVEAVDRLRVATPSDEPIEDLGALLRTLPLGAEPMLVWWTDEGRVTLAFEDDPDMPAPAPWTVDQPGGRTVWIADLGADGEEASWGLPLLVTLGRNDDRTIAINLGANPHLSLDGPDDLVHQRLLAIGIEVATSPLSGPLEVVTTDGDDIQQLERVRVATTLGEVVEESAEEHDAGLLPADRTPRLLLAKRGEAAPTLPPTVAGMVATVAVDTRPGWGLRVTSSSEAVLVMPDDARLPLVLPEVPADLVLGELRRLDQVSPLDSVEELPEPSATGNEDDGGAGAVDVPPPHFAEVRVLGTVDVVVDGVTVSLSEMTLGVLTYLAIHRDGVEAARLEEAVWGGTRSGSTQRVRSQLGKIRAALGDGPDGEPLLAARTADDLRIVLSDAVGTDMDRAMGLVQHGRRAGGEARRTAARAALGLVRGRPFELLDTRGLPEWAAEAEHVAIARLQDEAVWLSQHERAAGRFDEALWAVQRGLDLFDLAEELWSEWLRVAADAEDRDEVRRVMVRARAVLSSDADEVTGTALGPSSDLEGLYGQLLAA